MALPPAIFRIVAVGIAALHADDRTPACDVLMDRLAREQPVWDRHIVAGTFPLLVAPTGLPDGPLRDALVDYLEQVGADVVRPASTSLS